MAGGENFLAQLKAIVDPLTVFNQYLSLKKSGNRYRALCPFHNEKTPSFYASDNGMFHCFGCGAGGDVITFVMHIEKLEFKETIQLLSSRYGIPLKFANAGERKEKDQLLDLMRQAADFFHNLLTGTETGNAALRYLQERAVSAETVKRFRLGWAPASWNALLEHFSKRDVQPALLERCGLVVPRQKEGYYDRYRSRIMIPIHDIHGNIIAFGGRIFPPSQEEAKYMNSPEMQIYIKSNHLFGLYFAKEEIQSKKFAILVEGYFDMIMPFQAGVGNIVASLGTSLTEAQARLLRRYTDRVVLFYDPDTAGQNAALRAIPILLRENFAIQIGTLPEQMDPDQFIRQKGAEAFETEANQAMRYDQLFLQKLTSRHDLKTPGGRLAASEELLDLLQAMNNPFERDQVMNRFASALSVPVEVLQDMFRKKKRSAQATTEKSKLENRRPQGAEKCLLQILLLNPVLVNILETNDYEDLAFADIFHELRKLSEDNPEATSADLIHEFQPGIQSFLTSIIMEKQTESPSEENARYWLQKIRSFRHGRHQRHITAEIKKDENHEDLNRLLEEKVRRAREAISGKPDLDT